MTLAKSQTPGMFTEIARRYDLLNHALSFNVDRLWRRRLVSAVGTGGGGRVLDVATGTGDVAVAFLRRSRASMVVGVDPADGMLRVAAEKRASGGLGGRIALVGGDALWLPFADASFEAVTIAFGLRNLPDYQAGIDEMARVLRPGGRLAILEFSPPGGGVFLAAYRWYLRRVLPRIGRVVSGSPAAYRYLAASIDDFIPAASIRRCLTRAGLGEVSVRRLSGGIAYIHMAVRRD